MKNIVVKYRRVDLMASIVAGLVVTAMTFIIAESLVGRLLGIIIGIFTSFVVLLVVHEESDTDALISCKMCSRSALEIWPVLSALFALTVIMVMPSNPSTELFQQPSSIPLTEWVRHLSAIMLTTFLPGYFILRLIDKERAVRGFSVIVFSFLLSIFAVFLVGCSVMVAGGTIGKNAPLAIVVVNGALLSLWFFKRFLGSTKKGRLATFAFQARMPPIHQIFFIACMLFVVYIASYGLCGSHLIGDQRVHHGWALLYKEFLPAVEGRIDSPAPWVFPVYLATLFSLTNLPTVNAQNSLNMLNILPILSFYSLLSAHFKGDKKGLPELATFFAFLTGGVGWIFAEIKLAGATSSYVAKTIYESWLKTYDILTSNSFLFAGHPDITTPLILVGLTSTFMLIYLASPEATLPDRLRYFLMSALVALGFLAHPEALIIIAILTVFFTLKCDLKGGIAVLAGLLVVLGVDLSAPAKYYSLITITLMGEELSLLLIAIVGVLISLATQIMRARLLPTLKILHRGSWGHHKKIVVLLVSLVTYIYLFSYFVWASIVNDFRVLYVFGFDGSVPWYFYPVRLGIVGLLALPSIVYALSYSRRSHGLFLLWGFVIIASTLFYKEYRIIKHLHVVLSVFAAYTLVMITKRLSSTITLRRIVMAILIPLIILAAIGSPLLYVEYTQSKEGDYGVLPNRIPPSPEEYEALNWLRQRLDRRNETVITFARGADNFLSEVVHFSGAWIVRTNLFYRFFEIQDAESFIMIAHKTNLKYIYLTHHDIEMLEKLDTYVNSYIRDLISHIPPAFNNSLVEIYEVPKMTPPTESNIALVLPASTDIFRPLPNFARQHYNYLVQTLALAGVNYEIVRSYDTNLFSYDTLILPHRFHTQQFEDYLAWSAEGGRLIILEPPALTVTSIDELDWRVLKGNWSTAYGRYIQYDTRGSSALVSKQTFSSYSIEVSVRAMHATDKDNHLGLMLNFQDTDNWDYVFLREGQLVLFRLRDGIGKEVWWSSAERLNGEFYNLRVDVQSPIFCFYLNDVLHGMFVDDNPLRDGSVGFRTCNLVGEFRDLTLRVVSLEEANQTSVFQTEPSFTHEEYGLGEISYLNFPLYLLEMATAQERWWLLNVLSSSLIKAIPDPPRSSPYVSSDIMHVNYASGSIQVNHATLYASSVYVPASLVLRGDLEVYSSEGQKELSTWTLEQKYVDIEMRHFNVLGEARWELETEYAKFSDQGESRYFVLEPGLPLMVKIVLRQDATLKLAVTDGYVKNIIGEKYILLHIKELKWAYYVGSLNPYILIRSPRLASNGEVTFKSAHLSRGAKNVFVKERPLSMKGDVRFNLEFIDGEIKIISNMEFDAEINVQESKGLWDEWNVRWDQLLTSPFNFLLILLIISSAISVWTGFIKRLKCLKVKFRISSSPREGFQPTKHFKTNGAQTS